MTVQADRVIDAKTNPSNPNACSHLTFYEWTDVPGTVMADVTYYLEGTERSPAQRPPPFDDAVENFNPPRYAPPGRHRILVAYGSAAGGSSGGSVCETDSVPKLEAKYSPTGTVLLTIEGDSPDCVAARAKLEKFSGKVSKVKSQIRKESDSQKKQKLRKKLKKAKQKRKDAKGAEATACA